jgi:ComF family protein
LRKPPAYDRCYAAFRYDYPINRLLTALKFERRLAYADLLGQLTAERLADAIAARPECLIPMPLHPRRLRERGFNQALELARVIGRRAGVPLAMDCCQRIRHTPPQMGLSAQDRRRNIKGAFAALRPLPYGHVAIVDDIVTTGRSVEELAATLSKAGVERIDIWACARTPVPPK